MGIKGLTKLIQQYAEDSFKENNIKAYFGRAIAIDATMCLYQFLIAVRHGGPGQGQLTNDAGETTSHIIGFFYRTIRMMENGIKPIYIFDGKPPDFKSHELEKRKEKRKIAEEELKEAEKAGDQAKVTQMQKRTVRASRQDVADVQELLTLMGVPWYAAPGEAEAQASRMCAQGIVYGTGTEDMDALTFGTTKMVRRLTDSEAKKRPCLEFDLQRVLSGMEVTMAQFIDICILCGCDYCPSIRGIGPKKAYEFIKTYGSIEVLLKQIASDDKMRARFIIPEEWKYQKARQLFISPDVTDKEDLPKFTWDMPKEKELTEYLVDRMNFSLERVHKGIDRLKKCKKKGQQKRLDTFFKVKPSPAKSGKNAKKGQSKGKLLGKKRKRGNEKEKAGPYAKRSKKEKTGPYAK